MIPAAIDRSEHKNAARSASSLAHDSQGNDINAGKAKRKKKMTWTLDETNEFVALCKDPKYKGSKRWTMMKDDGHMERFTAAQLSNKAKSLEKKGEL